MFAVTITPRHEARLTVTLHILVEHPIPVHDHISIDNAVKVILHHRKTEKQVKMPPQTPVNDYTTIPPSAKLPPQAPITDYRTNPPPPKLSPQIPVNDYSTIPQPVKAKQAPQTPMDAYRTKPSLAQLPPKTPTNDYMTNPPPAKLPSQTSVDAYRKIPPTDLPVSFFISKDPV